MDIMDLIRFETKRAYAWLEQLVSDVSPDQANWRSPGTANTIAATYAHIVVNTDVDVTRHYRKQQPLIVGEWAARLGTRTYSPEEWREHPDVDWDAHFDWEALREFGREVRRQIERQVDELTAEELGREFEMVGVNNVVWKCIDVYALHGWNHVAMHGGEIACLKGLQGGTGYRPFRPDASR